MVLLGNWWAPAPDRGVPRPVTINVKSASSGRFIVLDARQLANNTIVLELPEHVLDALEFASAPLDQITLAHSDRALTPPSTYQSAPCRYSQTVDDLKPLLEPPTSAIPPSSAVLAASVPSRRVVHQRSSRQATHQPEPRPVRIPAAATEHRTPLIPVLPPVKTPLPVVGKVQYKIRGAEYMSCFHSSSASPLPCAPTVHASVGDTYVHRPPDDKTTFRCQIWIFRRPTRVEREEDGIPAGTKWFKAKTRDKHPDGRDLYLGFNTNRKTIQWMRYNSCVDSREPGL